MPKTPSKPSEAVAQGLCPGCLGQKIVYNLVEQRETDCHMCGGVGTLDAMFERQCYDPDCPDHPVPFTGAWGRLREAEELLTDWFRWWRDSDEAPAKMPNSLHTRTVTHLVITAIQDGRDVSGPEDL